MSHAVSREAVELDDESGRALATASVGLHRAADGRPAPVPPTPPWTTNEGASRGGVRRSRNPARPYAVLSWLVPLGLLGAWEVLARVGVIPSTVLPLPSSVLETAREGIVSGELPGHLAASLRRAVLGFALGSTTGFALGALVALSRLAESLLDRTLQMIRAIPFLAILPIVVVWFGIGEWGKVVLVALATMFPLYLNTFLGIRQVDPKLLEMGRAFGLPRRQLLIAVVLPGALPSVLNGVRLALTSAWLALVAAEAIGASAGIGFLATNAREFLQTDVIVLVIVIYALIGMASDLIARWLERRLLAWHPNFAGKRPIRVADHAVRL